MIPEEQNDFLERCMFAAGQLMDEVSPNADPKKRLALLADIEKFVVNLEANNAPSV